MDGNSTTYLLCAVSRRCCGPGCARTYRTTSRRQRRTRSLLLDGTTNSSGIYWTKFRGILWFIILAWKLLGLYWTKYAASYLQKSLFFIFVPLCWPNNSREGMLIWRRVSLARRIIVHIIIHCSSCITKSLMWYSEAARSRYLKSEADRREIHSLTATYFAGQPETHSLPVIASTPFF